MNSFDGLGNLLSASDGKGKFTYHFYDAASQRTQTVDRAGFTNLFFYTSRGRLDRATDALGNTATNFYDAANRLERVSDPLGGTVTNFYDGNGRVYAFTDKAGRRFLKRYDRLNRTIEETDPENNTRRTKYDVAGRVQQITSPNGFPSTYEYDGRGRLMLWKDFEGFPCRYQYDGSGNIVDIEDALHGHYVMAYGPRNQRILERNQDEKEWHYTYDELLRLKTQTDPNHIGRTNAYDNGGRLLSVTFSTDRINSFQYDTNNNPTNLKRAKGVEQTTLQLDYDALDRPTNQIDQIDFATRLQVEYGRDPLGRVTNLVYPGIFNLPSRSLRRQFDALGRLTNLVDWTNQTMTFQYDPADRLIRRTYPNGVVQTNSFDNAGRITGLSYSSLNPQPSTINLALTYAYDRNGNKTNWTETGTLAWTPPATYDERSGFTASGRITNRVDALNPARNFSYQFDASRNMTNCVGGGESFALTYDEDNRVTTLNWTNGTTNKNIPNRYDVFGRRIERTVNGRKTSYALDLSGDMERILFEKDDVGNFSYFIHAPDLCYRIDQTNGNHLLPRRCAGQCHCPDRPRPNESRPICLHALWPRTRLDEFPISNLQPVSLCRLARRDGGSPRPLLHACALLLVRRGCVSLHRSGEKHLLCARCVPSRLARLRLPIRYEAGRKPALRRRRASDHAQRVWRELHEVRHALCGQGFPASRLVGPWHGLPDNCQSAVVAR